MRQAPNAPRRVLLFTRLPLLLTALAALTLVACESATSGTPSLPPGFEERTLPDVDVRGYLYIDPGGAVDLPQSLISLASSDQESVRALQLVALLGDTTQRYSASVTYLDEQGNRMGESQAGGSPDDEQWASAVQSDWQNGTGISLQEKYPSVWALVSLLPPDPLYQPVAAGFLRDATALSEALFSEWGIEVPGLGSALDLLRVSEAAFVIYADGLQAIPLDVTDDTVREAGLGLVAVASSGYPGPVVATLVDNFASLAGLGEVLIGEEQVQYRNVGGVVHLMVKAIGADLFFTLAQTREAVQVLMETVLASQE